MTRTAIWTDFGGVLTPSVPDSFTAMGLRVGVPTSALELAMRRVGQRFGTDAMAPLDTPLVGDAEWCVLVEDELAQMGIVADLADFATQWFADRPVNRAWLTSLRRLRRLGYFVGLLSNLPPSWEAHAFGMVPSDTFDEVVLSNRVGCRKPERAIFELAAAASGRPAGENVLVDDAQGNCRGALDAGWHAVHFRDTAGAVTDLEDVLARTSARLAEV